MMFTAFLFRNISKWLLLKQCLTRRSIINFSLSTKSDSYGFFSNLNRFKNVLFKFFQLSQIFAIQCRRFETWIQCNHKISQFSFTLTSFYANAISKLDFRVIMKFPFCMKRLHIGQSNVHFYLIQLPVPSIICL